MALDATIGGATADSYVTLAEADTYFAAHYSLAKSTAWVALSDPQQESVLRRACQMVDSIRVLDDEIGYGPLPAALIEYDWHDLVLHRLYSYQRLSFPRNIDVDAMLVAFIQQAVKDSQCEQASYLLAFDETTLSASMSGIKQEMIKSGPVTTSTTYNNDSGSMGTMIAPLTYELMRPFIRRTSRVKRA